MTLLETNTQTRPADLTHLGATELAALIASGALSAVEAVEAHIARIEQVNAKLNAVVVERYAAARAEAQAADARQMKGEVLGPLHGVPITIKECLDLAGTPSTFGLQTRANIAAAEDDRYVARMRAAGAIVLGKTNVSQLLMFIESDNPVYGRTNNPWNCARSAGGSSGGQGAIIAAGGSPLGLGNDVGGSVRIPAAFCGIASLKPTAGRTPDAGQYSVPLGQRAISSQVGVLARAVADVALGAEIINGGRTPAVEPPMPFGDYQAVDVANLRVGFYTDDGTLSAAPGVRRAVREAANILRDCGARVTAWSPPDVPHALELFFSILSADGGELMTEMLGRGKRDPRIAMILMLAQRSRPTLSVLGGLLKLLGQPSMAATLRGFGHRTTADYWRMVEAQMAYQQRFLQALDQAEGGPFDIILCPACAVPAFTHGASRDLILGGAYTALYNVLGYPAGIVPLTRVRAGEESDRPASRDIVEQAAHKVELGSAGLPVGVQVVARPWREHVALAAMQAIERAAHAQAEFPAAPPV
jgi:fatty acid amide hydrolase